LIDVGPDPIPAMTAAPQPKKTSVNVPINSAIGFFIGISPHQIACEPTAFYFPRHRRMHMASTLFVMMQIKPAKSFPA
jgi:hypothetical protein